MKLNVTLRRYLVLSAISGFLLIAATTLVILTSVLHVFEVDIFVQLSFILAGAFFFVVLIRSFQAMVENRKFVAQLELENSYTLGHDTPFYNFDAFKNRVIAMRKKTHLKKCRQFMIAFTCTSAKVSTNAGHNEMITSLNYATTLYLSDLFDNGRGMFSTKSAIYGFNRGIFLLYIFTNEEKTIPELITTITTNIYRIVKEKSLKVWVQPFYGIKEVEEDENIVGVIEDAFIARNVSETNYETYTFFNPSFKKTTSSDDINDIEEALRKEEFVPYYQPKFSLIENKFVSCEALARWNSSKYGFLTPAMFIDKAEVAGMISLIDNYIFEKVLQDISTQLRKGRRVVPVSVNFSIYEFYSQGFINNLIGLLNKYGVPPQLIEVEITETTSQANQFISISIIKKLKEMGIRVLMDDFGIGYSGIDNLRKIPFDAIKIDKSFADGVLDDEKTRSIVKMMVELGHLNGLEVIIEGVDNQKQVDLLRKMKIDTIQGFYYSKALPLEQFDDLLRENEFEKKEAKK